MRNAWVSEHCSNTDAGSVRSCAFTQQSCMHAPPEGGTPNGHPGERSCAMTRPVDAPPLAHQGKLRPTPAHSGEDPFRQTQVVSLTLTSTSPLRNLPPLRRSPRPPRAVPMAGSSYRCPRCCADNRSKSSPSCSSPRPPTWMPLSGGSGPTPPSNNSPVSAESRASLTRRLGNAGSGWNDPCRGGRADVARQQHPDLRGATGASRLARIDPGPRLFRVGHQADCGSWLPPSSAGRTHRFGGFFRGSGDLPAFGGCDFGSHPAPPTKVSDLGRCHHRGDRTRSCPDPSYPQHRRLRLDSKPEALESVCGG
jgi:hypothetical protein